MDAVSEAPMEMVTFEQGFIAAGSEAATALTPGPSKVRSRTSTCGTRA